MDISNYKDFYIDIDGDIKISELTNSSELKKSSFITNTNKLNSEYCIAKSIDEIEDVVGSINYMFKIDKDKVFKQYSLKKDNQDNLKSVKLYYDFNLVKDNITTIAIGYDINSSGVRTEYYFTGLLNDVKNFIKENKINYEIKIFETHEPFLYSFVKSDNGDFLNFKVYYLLKENIRYYNSSLIQIIKKMLKF